jgi:hypothetical protein
MKPTRNLKYLAWIRTLPCLVCGVTTGIEAAHTGPHGMAQKSPDTSAIPLCVKHHRTGRDSYHKLGARAFERHHQLDIGAVVARLRAKPSIRIECGSFVGRYGIDDYVLGPVQIGLTLAIRRILTIRREGLSLANFRRTCSGPHSRLGDDYQAAEAYAAFEKVSICVCTVRSRRALRQRRPTLT